MDYAGKSTSTDLVIEAYDPFQDELQLCFMDTLAGAKVVNKGELLVDGALYKLSDLVFRDDKWWLGERRVLHPRVGKQVVQCEHTRQGPLFHQGISRTFMKLRGVLLAGFRCYCLTSNSML